MNFSNDLTLNMQTVLNDHLAGKRFVYRTKNGGETFGVVAEVLVSKAITWDPDTQKNFSNSIEYAKHQTKEPKPEPIPVRNYYCGYTLIIFIKSTNNISYRLYEDNIYILND